MLWVWAQIPGEVAPSWIQGLGQAVAGDSVKPLRALLLAGSAEKPETEQAEVTEI